MLGLVAIVTGVQHRDIPRLGNGWSIQDSARADRAIGNFPAWGKPSPRRVAKWWSYLAQEPRPPANKSILGHMASKKNTKFRTQGIGILNWKCTSISETNLVVRLAYVARVAFGVMQLNLALCTHELSKWNTILSCPLFFKYTLLYTVSALCACSSNPETALGCHGSIVWSSNWAARRKKENYIYIQGLPCKFPNWLNLHKTRRWRALLR